MKKIFLQILYITATVAISTRSFAQKTQIEYENGPLNPIFLYNDITGITTKMFGSAGTFDFGLYMGSAGSTSLSQMQLVELALSPNAATSTAFNAGVFSTTTGYVTSPGNVANTLNFQADIQYAFLIAGWSAADGSTYQQAAVSVDPYVWLGISDLGFVTPVVLPTPPPHVFGTSPGQVLGFTLTGSPEPATIALGSLGAAALLLFRRRK
jgi:hypothetical protein